MIKVVNFDHNDTKSSSKSKFYLYVQPKKIVILDALLTPSPPEEVLPMKLKKVLLYLILGVFKTIFFGVSS